MAFGLKYFAELRSRYMKTLWRVEIAQRNYSGDPEEMTFSGSSPIKVTWEKRGDDFYTPVKASEATITILCKENFHYLGLFTSDPRYYRMSIFRNGALYWRGFVTADLYSEKFDAPPYEVSIKAVDGFNLLSSVDFRDLLGIGITGRKSLRQLIQSCIDLLELDLPLVDWIDLYGENMNENVSPLSQTYLDIERLFFVYEEPSYRDILELCVAPFAAQIFQSGGSLHLRRIVTLYESSRPSAFYNGINNIGKVPLLAGTDRRLTGARIPRLVSVPTQRELSEDMWKDDLYIIGDSTTLDIVPALKNIAINVTNKSLGDLSKKLGFLDPDAWIDTYSALSFSDRGLKVTGNSSHLNTIIQTEGVHVEQCGFLFTWDFMMIAAYNSWYSSGGMSGHSTDPTQHTVTIQFGAKVVASDGTTFWLDINGHWNDEEISIEQGVKPGSEQSVKIEIDGIPCTGTLYFYIKQTLIGNSTTSPSGRGYSYAYEYMNFVDMHLDVDAGDLYDIGLAYNSLVNPANNIDMDISLPVSDIPAIPNDQLLYALYYIDGGGQPTRMWHTKGKDDYGTLLDHIALCARRLRQMPSKRLTGDIFTSLHIDLNSVIIDDKYLSAAYAVNSVEVQALDDSYNCELVEMPKYIDLDVPLEGDNCIRVARFHVQISACVRCLDFIIVKTINNEILRFDTITRNLETLYSSAASFDIFPADDGFVRVDSTTAYYCDYRGIVRNTVPLPSSYAGFITFFNGAFCMYYHSTGSSGSGYSRVFAGLMTPPSSAVTPTATHVAGGSTNDYGDQMYGTLRSALVTKNQIVVNTTEGAFLHDKRYHSRNIVNQIGDDYCDIKAIDDNYWVECRSTTDMAHLCRRTSILTAEDIDTIGRYSQKAAVSMANAANIYDHASVYNYKTQEWHQLWAASMDYWVALDVMFIYGDLYFVSDEGIYKYCPGYETEWD